MVEDAVEAAAVDRRRPRPARPRGALPAEVGRERGAAAAAAAGEVPPRPRPSPDRARRRRGGGAETVR